jgi:hypothetical protein
MEESSPWIWAQPADFVTRRAAPLSQIGELQVMLADHQRQLAELTGAIDRIDDPDILAQLAGAAPIGLASALVGAEVVSL